MYKKYKVVVNTAAGRRRYMKYLIPYVLSSSIVDRYDLWINTHNTADIEFFKRLAEKYDKVNLVWQPDEIVNGNKTINAFYKQCIEENTIYFKLDDDIVWMEPDLIRKMVEFRVDNPDYFLVSPLVINNSLSTYLLQVRKRISFSKYYNASSSHKVLWKNGSFAFQLHQWFIENFLKTHTYNSLYIGKQEMGMTRFSINAILWFGDIMKRFNGIVEGDDEEFLSCIYPSSNSLINCWNGDAILSHFAFFTQRFELDRSDILSKYGEVLMAEWEGTSKMDIYESISKILEEINLDIKNIMNRPSPYKKVVSYRSTRKKVILNFKLYIKYIERKIFVRRNFILK